MIFRRWSCCALLLWACATSGSTAAQGGFVWLYSVTGYEVGGAKRALLRTVALADTASLDVTRSRWRLVDSRGSVALDGAFRALPTTYGIRLWEADFRALARDGTYVLEASVIGGDGQAAPALRTEPFDVGAYILTRKTFAAISYRNAELRNADATHGYGFYDCNSLVGEGRSHGAFLSGLVNAFVARKDRLSAEESRRYVQQMRVAVNYLLDLQDAQTGRFSNSSPKRRAPPEDRPVATPFAVWGLATFLGELGQANVLDAATVARISRAVQSGAAYLQTAPRNLNQPHFAAAINMRLYQFTREQRYADAAVAGLLADLPTFNLTRRGGYANEGVAPYFEGLFHFLREFATHPRRADLVGYAITIARRDYASVFATNGFHLLPIGLPRAYQDAVRDPSAVPQGTGAGNFWPNARMARLASDAIYLASITGDRGLADVAAAGLGWITGLNTGVPSRYTSRAKGVAPDSLVAAAYIANISENFALPWNRWFWPGDQGKVMSIVNGAVVSPERGWVYDTGHFEPSETFILSDGLFLSAMTAYEDYVNKR